MILRIIKHIKGIGNWDDEEVVYRCPCGKGTVVESKEKEPGYRQHTAFIVCDNCEGKYELIKEGGYYNQAKEIKNGR